MKNYSKLKKQKLMVLGLDGYRGQPIVNPVPLGTFYKSIEKSTIQKRKNVIKNYFSEVSIGEIQNSIQWFTKKLDNVKEAGWALLIHKDDKKLEKLLAPLIKLRKGKLLYYKNEKPYEFMEKNGGWDVNLNKIPYYILIAGSLNKIPVELQYLLDVRRSVGRLYFEDESDYKIYAEKIAKYESKPKKNILFFAPVHGKNDATFYSKKYLVDPLYQTMKDEGYKLKQLSAQSATEEGFFNEVSKTGYDVIFSASHGMAIDDKFAIQKYIQGSIVCQDGKFHPNIINNNKGIITGFDILNKKVDTKIWFMFACYCAGTMKRSDFSFWVGKNISNQLKSYQSRENIISYLPQKLLASEDGPFSIIAHIDPAWVFSFMDAYQQSARLLPFKNVLKRIMKGVPVGRAMRGFNTRYAALSVALLNYVIDHLEKGEKINPLSISNIWVTRQDAQNYIILGDPAFKI